MKKLVVIIMMSVVGLSAIAQQDSVNMKKAKPQNEEIKTIFGDQDISHGGFAAFTFDYTKSILDKNALLLGARGGWIMNHWFSMGLGGSGLVSSVVKDVGWNGTDPKSLRYFMGYGGLYLEVAVAPRFPVHITFPVLLGVGGCAFYDDISAWDPESEDWEYRQEDSDAFIILEPGAILEINVLKNLRLGFGATYRYVEDFDLVFTQAEDLNGLNYNFTMKFGKF